MFKKIFNYIRQKWAYLLSLLFIWCIPILLLTEIVVLAKMYTGIRLTFIGYIVVCVVLFALKRKIAIFISKQNKTLQIVLFCLGKAVLYGVVLIGILAINTFSNKLFKWWVYSGISWGIGVVFYIIDKIKEKENGEEI